MIRQALSIVFAITFLLLFIDTAASLQTSDYFIEQGNIYLREKKNPEAIDAYKEAISLDPKRVDAHYWLGTVYIKQKEYGSAIRELEWVASNPNASYPARRTFTLLIFISLFKKDDDRTIGYLKKLFTVDPDSMSYIMPYIFYARLFGLKQTEDGFEVFKPLTAPFEDKTAKDAAIEATNLYDNGQYLQAIETYKKVLNKNLSPIFKAAIYNTIGMIYVKELQRPSEGIPFLEQAVALNPKEFALKIGLVDAYRMSGDYDKALNQVRQILAQEPSNRYGLYAEGVLHFKKGEWKEATVSWQKLQQVDKVIFSFIEESYRQAKQRTHFSLDK